MTQTLTMDAAPAVDGLTPETPLGTGATDDLMTELPPMEAPVMKDFAKGVASNVKQHGIACLDISGSMGGAKIDESNLARAGLISTLADPANKDGFRVTVIEFNRQARRVTFGKPAGQIQLAPSRATGGTSFEAALQECVSAVQEFAAQPNTEGWHWLRPVVIYMSDGQSSASDATIAALHEVADVIAIAFGSDANQAMLSKIASDGQVHRVGTSGDELRKFLATVGQTMSQSLQTHRI